MKKKILCIMICSILVLEITGCGKEDKELKSTNWVLTKTNNCKNKATEYYKSYNRKVYFVCIDEIKKNEDMTLKYYFQNVNQTFDRSIEELTHNLELKEIYKDGGTKIFKSKNMTMIVCHHEKADYNINQDIYIGDEKLEFDETYCEG